MQQPLPKIFPPVFALLFAAAMWAVANGFPIVELIPDPWNRFGYIVMAIAISIDLWSLGLFLRAKTTFHPLRLHETSSLVTGGMYRVTRNPMYLGLLLLLTGWAILLGELLPWMLLPIFVWLLNTQQIQHEERILEEKFGGQYLQYKERVRRWI
ncbi:hypothetical protein BOV90_09570 [Solemya velum gill symbiont]|nr:isoprenylcysteine carboxylmethyltransferase family protein [Solemya velum gill symbiont]OOY34117.1 hypothetical protein BOV88_11785 [Solemya velum gill symbiont]OOY36772.1 hypothetical protein BOV89_10915 [Solemya velum gill symbiont]OOY39414.1 hypothetical protein BOV90_09570 [Solemya velum gill symbiont]OOY44420.1 hypothetical protein BOV91_01430 [Solemya velum gill symbiont]OOY45926.1 hypothetical protein BOV92_04100 [Solemya velum gill symbiont]